MRPGFDVVLVETVGVGQDEVEIARLADVTLVVLVPGMGDDVQAIKAGIMEIADVFVINKADLPGADKLERELNSYLALVASRRTDGRRRSSQTVANANGQGDCGSAGSRARISCARVEPRADGAKSGAVRLREMLRERLLDRFRLLNSTPRDAKWRSTGAILIRFFMTGSNASKIDHLGIAVRSLDQALEFYRDQLGLDVSLRETVEHEKVQRRDAAAGRAAHRAAGAD